MIPYKEFIEKMKEKGHTHKNDKPIKIDESDNMIKTFPVNKGSVGKILELQCPDNCIISLCGTEHNGGCNNSYVTSIKCIDNNNKQPFQNEHRSTALTRTKHDSTTLARSEHVLAEIIATKILQQDPPLDNKKVKDWSEKIAPILKLIKSDNPREHIMWTGAYPRFSSEFIKTSFTLYGGQKMILYANNPSIDIDKVEFNISLDIFEKLT